VRSKKTTSHPKKYRKIKRIDQQKLTGISVGEMRDTHQEADNASSLLHCIISGAMHPLEKLG
jgi:hypothetical protein